MWNFVTVDEPDTGHGDVLVATAEQFSAGSTGITAYGDEGEFLGHRAVFQIEVDGKFIWVYVEVSKDGDGSWGSLAAFKEADDVEE